MVLSGAAIGRGAPRTPLRVMLRARTEMIVSFILIVRLFSGFLVCNDSFGDALEG